MAGFYYLGRWSGRNDLPTMIEGLIDMLESEGFIVTELDNNGEKELVQISEIIAQTVRETTKAAK